jgi:hypothetical protein
MPSERRHREKEDRQPAVQLPLPIASDGSSPQLDAWLDLLGRLGLTVEQVHALSRRAVAHGTTLYEEVVTSAHISEECLYRELAAELRLPFRAEVGPDELILKERDAGILLGQSRGRHLLVKAEGKNGATILLLGPASFDLIDMRERFRMRRSPESTAPGDRGTCGGLPAI